MTVAIQFNNQFHRNAIKIRDVMAQWLLTPKAQAIHLLSAQMPPQPLFR
jgi:hypothetical protein